MRYVIELRLQLIGYIILHKQNAISQYHAQNGVKPSNQFFLIVWAMWRGGINQETYRNIPVNIEIDLWDDIEGEQDKHRHYKDPWRNGDEEKKTHSSPVSIIRHVGPQSKCYHQRELKSLTVKEICLKNVSSGIYTTRLWQN